LRSRRWHNGLGTGNWELGRERRLLPGGHFAFRSQFPVPSSQFPLPAYAMRELLNDYDRMTESGPVGRAVVTEVWGSAPRPEGPNLLASPNHAMAGSVSGGCVENAVMEEIIQSIETGQPKTLQYGVTHERAWEFGLSCGGTISLLVEPRVRPELLAAA